MKNHGKSFFSNSVLTLLGRNKISSKVFAFETICFYFSRIFREKLLNLKTFFIFNSDIPRILYACWHFVRGNISRNTFSPEIIPLIRLCVCKANVIRVCFQKNRNYSCVAVTRAFDIRTNWIACGWERWKSIPRNFQGERNTARRQTNFTSIFLSCRLETNVNYEIFH